MAQDVLEEDLQRDGGAREVDPIGEGREPVDVGETGAQRRAGAEGILLVRGSALEVLCETRRMEAYSGNRGEPGA
jgi:hypothetical protein